jgi:hypothetical protein
LVEGTPRGLFLLDEVKLILADLFGAQMLGLLPEVLAELADVVRVGVNGYAPILAVIGGWLTLAG